MAFRGVIVCPGCGKNRWAGYGPCSACGTHAPDLDQFGLPNQWNVAPDGSGISHVVYDPDATADESR